jgi:uncharacterized protein DUF2399
LLVELSGNRPSSLPVEPYFTCIGVLSDPISCAVTVLNLPVCGDGLVRCRPLVCADGQFNTAWLLLLEALATAGCRCTPTSIGAG